MSTFEFKIIVATGLGLMVLTLAQPQPNAELEKQRTSILKLIGLLGATMLLLRAIELFV